jgi:hypothetical protein
MPTHASPARHARDWSIDPRLTPEQSKVVLLEALDGGGKLELRGPHPNVILCALPKSGSLHAAELLACALGLKNHQIGFQRRGGTIYYPRLLLAKFIAGGTLSHCHQPPTPDALELFQRLGLRPLILTRSIPDALVSRRDMLARDRWCSNLLTPLAHERYFALPRERQLDVVIDLFAPEYLGFAIGWRALRGDAMRPIFARYEDLATDEVGFVESVAAGLELSCAAEHVRAISAEIRDQGGINFSTGRVGRGREEFSQAQLERLRHLAQVLGAEDLPALDLAG